MIPTSLYILILCDTYPPEFGPRVAAWVRYLVAEGHRVVVATERLLAGEGAQHGPLFGEEDLCPTFRFPLIKRKTRLNSLKQAFLGAKDRRMIKAIRQQIPLEGLNLVIATSYRDFPLTAADTIARLQQVPFLADCRDIIEQFPPYDFLPQSPAHPGWGHKLAMQLLRNMYIARRNRALSHATAVTTVSPWHVATLQRQVPTVPIHLLYNGYDERYFGQIAPQQPSDKFVLLFAGRLHSIAVRNPHPLFAALAGDMLRPMLLEERIEVHWLSDPHSHQLLQEALAGYPPEVAKAQRFLPMVPLAEMAQRLSEASLLLLISEREHPKGPHGIVSTKIFEYFAAEKPILMIPSDEGTGAELLGCFCDTLSTSLPSEAELFIHDWFVHWRKNGYTCSAKESCKTRKKYSRAAGCRQLAEHVAQLVASTK